MDLKPRWRRRWLRPKSSQNVLEPNDENDDNFAKISASMPISKPFDGEAEKPSLHFAVFVAKPAFLEVHLGERVRFSSIHKSLCAKPGLFGGHNDTDNFTNAVFLCYSLLTDVSGIENLSTGSQGRTLGTERKTYALRGRRLNVPWRSLVLVFSH